MVPVEPEGMSSDESLHSDPEVRLWRLGHGVNVRVHEAVGVNTPPAVVGHMRETLDEARPVSTVLDDLAATVATGDHVVNRAGDVDTVSPGQVFEPGRCAGAPQDVRFRQGSKRQCCAGQRGLAEARPQRLL
jgi:hypothetical protein